MKPRLRFGAFLLAGVAVAAVLAFVVSPQASSQPDGLERVAIDEGFSDSAREHDLATNPTADYGVRGIESERLSTGVAGLIGLAVTGAVATVVGLGIRRAGRSRAKAAEPAPTPAPPPPA